MKIGRKDSQQDRGEGHSPESIFKSRSLHQLPPYLTLTDQPSEVLDSKLKELNPDHTAVLVDENTRKCCLPKIKANNPLIIEISSGEKNKTLQTCEYIWDELTKNNFTRKSVLINVGGGVISDMGGFAASTFKRGIKFINLPTTLLAQVDASIGGKLAIDYRGFKNHIGLFKNPDHVIVDWNFLQTLPERELKSGYVEVIKHALISDGVMWNEIYGKSIRDIPWDEIILKSITIKNRIVADDPMEEGVRKILNFGHTLGHALESHFMTTSDPLLHGEAIALGIILESHLSFQKGWLDIKEWESIRNYLQTVLSLPASLPNLENLLNALLHDKKNDSDGINFSLLREIGHCEHDIKVSRETIEKSLSAYSLTK